MKKTAYKWAQYYLQYSPIWKQVSSFQYSKKMQSSKILSFWSQYFNDNSKVNQLAHNLVAFQSINQRIKNARSLLFDKQKIGINSGFKNHLSLKNEFNNQNPDFQVWKQTIKQIIEFKQTKLSKSSQNIQKNNQQSILNRYSNKICQILQAKYKINQPQTTNKPSYTINEIQKRIFLNQFITKIQNLQAQFYQTKNKQNRPSSYVFNIFLLQQILLKTINQYLSSLINKQKLQYEQQINDWISLLLQETHFVKMSYFRVMNLLGLALKDNKKQNEDNIKRNDQKEKVQFQRLFIEVQSFKFYDHLLENLSEIKSFVNIIKKYQARIQFNFLNQYQQKVNSPIVKNILDEIFVLMNYNQSQNKYHNDRHQNNNQQNIQKIQKRKMKDHKLKTKKDQNPQKKRYQPYNIGTRTFKLWKMSNLKTKLEIINQKEIEISSQSSSLMRVSSNLQKQLINQYMKLLLDFNFQVQNNRSIQKKVNTMNKKNKDDNTTYKITPISPFKTSQLILLSSYIDYALQNFYKSQTQSSFQNQSVKQSTLIKLKQSINQQILTVYVTQKQLTNKLKQGQTVGSYLINTLNKIFFEYDMTFQEIFNIKLQREQPKQQKQSKQANIVHNQFHLKKQNSTQLDINLESFETNVAKMIQKIFKSLYQFIIVNKKYIVLTKIQKQSLRQCIQLILQKIQFYQSHCRISLINTQLMKKIRQKII